MLLDEGGNSGLGVETARALASAGARVILTSRKVSAGEEVIAKLQEDDLKVLYLLHVMDDAFARSYSSHVCFAIPQGSWCELGDPRGSAIGPCRFEQRPQPDQEATAGAMH